MLNRVCRCRTCTHHLIISVLAPPLPHRWQAGWMTEGRRAGKATPKGGGAAVERCAPVTVYIYFSPCLSRSYSLLMLRSAYVPFSDSPLGRVEVMSKGGGAPLWKVVPFCGGCSVWCGNKVSRCVRRSDTKVVILSLSLSGKMSL